MEAEALLYLTYLAVILLAGILCTLLSKKIKVPNPLLLILAGIILQKLPYKGNHLIEFPTIFITSTGILALVMVAFDSFSRLKYKEFDSFSLKILRLSLFFFFINLVFLSFFTKYIFGVKEIVLAVIFAVIMGGAEYLANPMFKDKKKKVFKILEIESIISVPLILLVLFIIIESIKNAKVKIISPNLIDNFAPFLQNIIIGIGVGILVGLIVFKVMRGKYSERISPIAIITAALLAYILAGRLGGNEVFAVGTMAFFFGNVYIKEKRQLQKFSSIFIDSLEIFVFILIGLIIDIPLTLAFFYKSLMLFFAYLLIRLVSVNISLYNLGYSMKEKFFLALNAQKGVAVAVIALTLTTMAADKTNFLYEYAGLKEVLGITLIFIAYSIIFSAIAIKFSNFFTEDDN